jgi:stage III sporulation protein SpoIIIAA
MDEFASFTNSPSTTSYMEMAKSKNSGRSRETFTECIVTMFPELDQVMETGRLEPDRYVSDIVLDESKPVRLHIFSEREYVYLQTRPVSREDIDTVASFCDMTRCQNRFRVRDAPGYRVSLLPTLNGFNVTIRMARLDLCHDFPMGFLTQLAKRKNILIFGAPGSGKTTCLRSVMRVLDEKHVNAVAIDQSDELSMSSIGIRVHYPDNSLSDGILETVRNHTPACILLDEIVTKADVAAVMNSNDRGVQIIATTHASTIANIISNPIFLNMNGGRREAAVSDTEVKKTGNKFLVERRTSPTFEYVYDVRAKKLYNLEQVIDNELKKTHAI